MSTKPTEHETIFLEKIAQHNKTHIVSESELAELLEKAQETYKKNFTPQVWFERSLFTNWTCAIADCKYCYLSTKPKLDKKAIRSKASILAEALVCKLMGWRVGYITGGLRVESTAYMTELLQDLSHVLGYTVRMNYGPYSKKEIESFKPYVAGLGSAIESFDEELHEFICPSKPLSSLLHFLAICKEEQIPNFITIILGIGEKKTDVFEVIEKINQYNIDTVQLCFLKPQEKTVFEEVPSPDPAYMAWWIATLRIAHPKLHIKVALVRDRISDFSLYLKAGANAFSRYMVFTDFASEKALALKEACEKEGRVLEGNFSSVPEIDLENEVSSLHFEEEVRNKILFNAKRYLSKLKKMSS